MNKAIHWTWEKTDSDLIAEIEAIGEDFELVIQCQKNNPPFVYRRCKANPTQSQNDLVFGLSGGQTGVRSFSGESFPDGPCARSYYLGWNTRGFEFDQPSCYCQVCGYGFEELARTSKVIIDASKISQEYIEDIRRKCDRTEIAFEIQDLISAPMTENSESKMQTEKYIAIWDARLGDYKWYDQPKTHEPSKDVQIPGVITTIYQKTGRFVTRDDGVRAEIFESIAAEAT